MPTKCLATLLLVSLMMLMAAVSASFAVQPTWTHYWDGYAELQQDAGGIGAGFQFHFLSVLYEGGQIWAYYINNYQSGGEPRSAVGRARSTDGFNWIDDGIVLDIGGAWQWKWEAEGPEMGHQIGRADGDGWSANVAQDDVGYLCYGPHTTAVPGGKNCASFKLMIDSNSGTDTAVTLDVYDVNTGEILESRNIRKNDFSANMTYQIFNLNFTSVAENQLEFRTYWHKKAYIKQDLVAVSQGHEPFWDARMASFPGIWKDGGVYYLVYEGAGTTSAWPGDIGLATSTDGRNFIKHPNNPILKHQTSGWEKANIGTPSLYKEGGNWYLFYHGFDGTDCRIGVATGTSLINLSRHSGNPIINTTNGAWDAGTAGKRSMIRKEGSYYYLAYEGSTDKPFNTAKWSSGLARSTNLLNWTKYSGNPIIPQTESGFGNDGPEIIQIGDVNYLYVRTTGNSTVRYKLQWKPGVLPAAPSNPGATNVTTNSIRWTWTDNSDNETGFKVYCDPGNGPPTTHRTTTAANVTNWNYTGLTANSRYCFQVAATNELADSSKTSNYTKHTLAGPPSIGNNVVCDKPTSVWHPGDTVFSFSNPAGFGIGTHGGSQYRVSRFTYAWNKNSTYSWSGSEPNWSTGTLALSPNAGDGGYYLHLRSWNMEGIANQTTISYGPFNIDSTPPSVPTNVQAVQESTSSVSITWTASTDNVEMAGYKVYRNGSQIGSTISPDYTDSGLELGSTYSYTVSAYDAVGNQSAQSSPAAVVTISDKTPPSVPTNVQATAQSETSIQVTWTASTDNVGVSGYKIFRNGSQVDTSGTTVYTDLGLSPATTYSYTVSAYDATGNESAQSSPAVATTPDNTPPSVPANVQATALSPISVEVTWTASTDNVGVTGYKIFRDGSLAGTSDSNSYTDGGLTLGATYSYTVSAYDASGNESAQSSAAIVTTPLGMDIGAAKLLTDASTVFLMSKVISAVFDDCVYVREPDDPAGIKVVATPLPPGLAVGKTVDVAGTIETTLPNHERYIAGTISVK